jgi:hypothetical protein
MPSSARGCKVIADEGIRAPIQEIENLLVDGRFEGFIRRGWRDGRVAEGGGLLNRCTVKSRTGGSNPPLSAILISRFHGQSCLTQNIA